MKQRGNKMNQSNKIIIAAAIIVIIVVPISAYVFLNSAFASLEQRENKDIIGATQNVEIQATTFNGKIEIQTSTSAQIEINYKIQAPKGNLDEIQTSTTNQTQNDSTKIIAEAEITATGLRVNYNADIIIKLPVTSQYNLTLSTFNGDIIKPQINDTNIIATTNNGNINIQDDNATSISASSQNGNVDLSLAQGTLFQVDATSANGHVSYQGIAMNTSIQTTQHLKGNTTEGLGKLSLDLSTANGNVSIDYFGK
jgi:DUF4097 and DUF4098 domain-containing protein YvlB